MTNEDKRFTGTVKRCPNSPYFIFDNKEHFKTFKHSQLENHKVLDDIVDLLNTLDDEIVLLQSDLAELKKPDTDFKYNINKLHDIREEYKEKLGQVYREKRDLEREYEELKKDYDKLVLQKEYAEKVAREYLCKERNGGLL